MNRKRSKAGFILTRSSSAVFRLRNNPFDVLRSNFLKSGTDRLKLPKLEPGSYRLEVSCDEDMEDVSHLLLVVSEWQEMKESGRIMHGEWFRETGGRS